MFPGRDVLVGRVRGVEAVGAIGVEREPGRRRAHDRVGGAGAIILVGAGDGAGDGGVFAARLGGIGRLGGIVHTDNSDLNFRNAECAVCEPNCIADNVGISLASPQLVDRGSERIGHLVLKFAVL